MGSMGLTWKFTSLVPKASELDGLFMIDQRGTEKEPSKIKKVYASFCVPKNTDVYV